MTCSSYIGHTGPSTAGQRPQPPGRVPSNAHWRLGDPLRWYASGRPGPVSDVLSVPAPWFRPLATILSRFPVLATIITTITTTITNHHQCHRRPLFAGTRRTSNFPFTLHSIDSGEEAHPKSLDFHFLFDDTNCCSLGYADRPCIPSWTQPQPHFVIVSDTLDVACPASHLQTVMPKSKAELEQAVKNVTAAWASRGYRHDYLMAHQGVKTTDTTGELAYQRAFAEAVKKVPPRLPNPAHYPKSGSAVALIQKQNQGIFNSRPSDAPNPKYEQPIPDMYWRPREDEARHQPASSTSPVSNGYSQPSPLQMNGSSPRPNGQPGVSPTITAGNPPLLMEPRLDAPRGPPSRLR